MRSSWKKRLGDLWIPIFYAAFYFPAFFWLEKTTRPKYYLHCSLDDLIPFCEWFVFPYVAWFALIPAVLLMFHQLDRPNFRNLCFVLFAGMSVCLMIYKLLPNGLLLRAPILGDNPAETLVRLLRSADSPTNVCPSIHVSSSVALAVAVWRSDRIRQRHPRVRLVVFGLSCLICISTLFLKQHSVLDLAAGLLLTLALYCLLGLRGRLEPQQPGMVSRVLGKRRQLWVRMTVLALSSISCLASLMLRRHTLFSLVCTLILTVSLYWALDLGIRRASRPRSGRYRFKNS